MSPGGRAYSFAGGPTSYGVGAGELISRSGPWKSGTQDYGEYWARVRSGEQTRVISLIDDDSKSYDQWVSWLKSIERRWATLTPKPYFPLPSDDLLSTPCWDETSANSNTWARRLLYEGGLLDRYNRAVGKLSAGDLPWAPGWDIEYPYYPE